MAATADDEKHSHISKERREQSSVELKKSMARDEANAKDAGSMYTDVAETENNEVASKHQAVEPKDTNTGAASEHEAVSVLEKLASEVAKQALGNSLSRPRPRRSLARDRCRDHR
jgi:hypothetical protein